MRQSKTTSGERIVYDRLGDDPMSAAQARLHYDPNDQALIFEVEQSLRRYVNSVMARRYGERWIESQSRRARLEVWRWRQLKARRQGEMEFSLIAFTDFPDLKDMVVRHPFWQSCFSVRFRDKCQFILAMDSIYTVRKALAHSLPITAEQRHVLVCASNTF